MAMTKEAHRRNLETLTGKSVMIVDDQAFIRRLVARALGEINGLSFIEAADGAEALNKLTLHGCDVILLDINMQPVNGLEALKRIRSGQVLARGIPVIMLTTVSDERAVRTAVALDVSGFIVKPMSTETLAAKLARALTTPMPLKAPQHYEKVPLPDLDDLLGEKKPPKPPPAPRKADIRPPLPGYQIIDLPATAIAAGDRLLRPACTSNGTELIPRETLLTAQLATSLHDLTEFVEIPSLTVEREIAAS